MIKKIKNLSCSEILSYLTALYCVVAVLMNIFEMKTLGTANVAIAGGGFTISWMVFLIGNVVTEVWDKHTATRIFTYATILNVIFTVFAQFIILVPGTYPEQNAAFAQIFSNGPRTITASAIAFWVGNFINVSIIDKLKRKTKNKTHKGLLTIRAVLSTIIGQFIDNIMFCLLAFAPIGVSAFEMRLVDIFTTSAIGTGIEVIVESLFVPIITIPLVVMLNRKKEYEECECCKG